MPTGSSVQASDELDERLYGGVNRCPDGYSDRPCPRDVWLASSEVTAIRKHWSKSPGCGPLCGTTRGIYLEHAILVGADWLVIKVVERHLPVMRQLSYQLIHPPRPGMYNPECYWVAVGRSLQRDVEVQEDVSDNRPPRARASRIDT